MTNLVRSKQSTVPALRQWTDEQVAMATRSFAADCNMAELEVFAEVAQRRQLDPWLGQIVAIKRGGKMIVQETAEGYRAGAERTGLYGGYRGPWWRTKDGPWDEVWLEDGYPAAAKILVIRKDWSEPAAGVAAWKSNAQFGRDGKLHEIWKNRPDEMLAKCAEVRALRRAFSKELAALGFNVRDLTDAQVVTVEAKRAGLDDGGRHELIAEVTGGRTSSSTDLTDEETIEVRQEIARRATEAEEPPAVRRVSQAGPPGTGDATFYVNEDGEQLSQEEGERREREQLGRRIKDAIPALTPEMKAELDQYRRDCGINPEQKANDYTLEQLHLVDAWLDRTLGEPY